MNKNTKNLKIRRGIRNITLLALPLLMIGLYSGQNGGYWQSDILTQQTNSNISTQFQPEALRTALLFLSPSQNEYTAKRNMSAEALKSEYTKELSKSGYSQILELYKKAAVDIAEGYDEETYLAANPDVTQAIINGTSTGLHSGYFHYFYAGKKEKRLTDPRYGYALTKTNLAAVTQKNNQSFQAKAYRLVLLLEAKSQNEYKYRLQETESDLMNGYNFQKNNLGNFYTTTRIAYLKAALAVNAGYDEEVYLTAYPDVEKSVEFGDKTKQYSGYFHYVYAGKSEKRLEQQQYKNAAQAAAEGFHAVRYQTAFPEVKTAIKEGKYASALDHYLKTGKAEEKLKNEQYSHAAQALNVGFSTDAYIMAYPTIKEAIKNGTLPSALFHYTYAGKAEGKLNTQEYRDAVSALNDGFREELYLSAFQDIADVMKKGLISSAYTHYQFSGKNEGRLQDDRYKKALQSIGVTEIISQSNERKPRIMLLGDSITEHSYAAPKDGGYRFKLWQKLTNASLPFDFVGSGNAREGAPNTLLYYDADNEGHAGWTTGDILKGINGNSSYSFDTWIKDANPDIVVIHLGTNDILKNQSTPLSAAVENMKTIISKIRTQNPKAVILMAKIIPTTIWYSNYHAQGKVIEYNTMLTDLAAKLTTKTSPIILVDQWTDITGKDLQDDVHPNSSGEEKIASKWFGPLAQAIKAFTLNVSPETIAPIIIEKLPAKILFIGNSLTHHAPASPTNNLPWSGNWGMAATSIENDYVHQVEKLLKNAGKNVTVSFSGKDVPSAGNVAGYLNENIQQTIQKLAPEYLVIQLSENDLQYVKDETPAAYQIRLAEFKNQYRDLIKSIQNRTNAKIYALSGWYEPLTGSKNTVIQEVLKEFPTVTFIDTTGISSDPTSKPCGHIVLMNLAEVAKNPCAAPFHFETKLGSGFNQEQVKANIAGILSHPGDLGMKRLGEKISGYLMKDL
ncbi:MAG: GDSL-type esterase/lipase family protein [Candidatus Gracilibacteria bacterium]